MDTQRPYLFGVMAGLLLAAGLVVSAMLLGRTWLRINEGESISVTGSARKAVRSDLIVWRGTAAVEAAVLLDAQKRLKSDMSQVETFSLQCLEHWSLRKISVT